MRDDGFIEALCDRFMVACEASGQLKQEFARSVGLTAQQISNISRYRNPPSHQAIAAAARVCGLTVDWFYTGDLAAECGTTRSPGTYARS